MAQYTGITIGPIFDTLLLAHSPAAMWYASSTFSNLTEQICKNITEQLPGCEILSPYYSGKSYNDGIGRYHDRIIFRSGDTQKAEDIINTSVEYMSDYVASDLGLDGDEKKSCISFLKNYFQVHYAVTEAENDGNVILALGEILDALEQMPAPNAQNTDNPFVKLFRGKEFRNSYIRDRVNSLAATSQLVSGGRFRSIPDIAGAKTGLKKNNYYAIVEADGDKMGAYLTGLGNDKVRDFSKCCFDYAEEAAGLIGEYGGMTVYAGGDDLLFIAPVESSRGTVFDLCSEISAAFTQKVAGGAATPTVSFGIAVRYENFPLYEALNSSIDALRTAKKFYEDKNCMVIDCQKASGQSIKLAVPFDKNEQFKKTFSMYVNTDDDAVKSAIYALDRYRPMLLAANGDGSIISNVMRNAFDNEGQKKYASFVDKLAQQLAELISCSDGRLISDTRGGDSIKAFEMMLRLSKFMSEKEGKR